MSPAIRDSVFRSYVAWYQDVIQHADYEDLTSLQPAPYATLAHGGAGTAYVLWRLAQHRRARTWLDAALADRPKPAFEWPDGAPDSRTRHFFGPTRLSRPSPPD